MRGEQYKNEKVILHIAQSAGGVEQYLKLLFKYEKSNMYKHVLICSYDYNIHEFEKYGIEIEQIPMQRDITIKGDLESIFKLRKKINKYRPDIVYCHSSKAGALGRIATIGIKVKCIYNPHGWAFNMRCGKVRKRIYIYLERFLAHLTDYIVCISDSEKKSALKNRICCNKKIVVIKNGIDIDDNLCRIRQYSYKNNDIPKDSFVIGCTGRLDEQKAPDVFAKAAVLIKKYIKNAFFIYVGEGKYRERVEQIFYENNMTDSYLITGWIDNPINYVMEFDIAMLLSRWEGFGLVLPEYMIAGKPIVATNIDAIPEIIQDGVNGILVNVDSAIEVSEAVKKIYFNENLKKDLIKNAKLIVKKEYDVKRVVSEHQSLFNKV